MSVANMDSKAITIIGSLNMDLVTVTERMPAGGETMHALSFSTGAGGKGGNRKLEEDEISNISRSFKH
jgi:ribokinase